MIGNIIVGILLGIIAFYIFTLVGAPLYFKFGWFRKFYHDKMGWHQPDINEGRYYDGCSTHAVCRHCGKEIMQDSQGNWF